MEIRYSKETSKDPVKNDLVQHVKECSGVVAIANEWDFDLQALDEKVKSLMERSQNMISDGKQLNGTPKWKTAFICKVCGKVGQYIYSYETQIMWKEYLFHVISVIRVLVQGRS